MKKILKTVILGIISLFCSVFGQEVIFEHPIKLGEFFDGRIIRTPKREKFICFKWEDSLVIFNINTKKITKKKYREIDSMIIGGRIISDSPFMGVFIRDRSGIIKDIFVLETEGGYKIIELPTTNIGFYYNYYKYKDEKVIEIIGGIDKLLRYEVHINNNNEINIDKITEITSDSGGYNYVFGGENKHGEMIFSYPYFSTTRVVILRRKGENIEVEKRDPQALDIAVLGIKKYVMVSRKRAVIFDIDDENFYKTFENPVIIMITGTDEIALASSSTSWNYYMEIVNLNGEVIDRLYYKNRWAPLDAVMMGDSIIVVGAYYNEETNTDGIVVMVKRISISKVENKESKKSKEIQVKKIGKNTIEINSEVDEIVVYDVLGRIVKKEKGSRMILTNLSTGVYFVVCRNKDKIFIEKIYIIK